VVAVAGAILLAGCMAQEPVISHTETTPAAFRSDPAASPSITPSAMATASEAASDDPEDLIECRQVPEDLCVQVAMSVAQGPQPDYAAQIERILVTCEVLPPCAWDRGDSGGHVVILYVNGWAWSQDWAPQSGA